MIWRLLGSLSIVLLLQACETTATRDADDATGELGSAVQRQGPGDVYVQLGAAYLNEGRFSEALQNAKKAILVDPKSSGAHNLAGVIYQRLGDMDKAGMHFRRAVELDPKDPFALNAYGSFLCVGKRFDEADKYFQRALDNPLYPTPWVASHNAGQCAEQAGKLDIAEADYRAALQRNPTFAPSLLRMAEVSYRTANYLSARAYLQRYSQVARHTADSLWLGVRTEIRLGDNDQVAVYAEKLRKDFPDSEQTRSLNEVQR